MTVLRSRDNPRLRRWTRLAGETRLRRRERRALIEGPHLVAAMLERGIAPVDLIASETGLADAEIASLIARSGRVPVVLSDSLFKSIADAESPQGIAAEIALPDIAVPQALSQVFLEGIQDAGNVGAIVRSAAAFGIGAVILDRDCADAWSPKALRAGMGGHFALAVCESNDLGAAVQAFPGRVLCTASRGGIPLSEAGLSGQLAWVFGNEARGVSGALEGLASARVTIPLARGMESLNVAAAAAICLHAAHSPRGASVSRPGAGS